MSHRPHLPLVRIAALTAMIAGVALAVPAAATDRVVVVQPGDPGTNLRRVLEQQRPEEQQVIVVDEIALLLPQRVVGEEGVDRVAAGPTPPQPRRARGTGEVPR